MKENNNFMLALSIASTATTINLTYFILEITTIYLFCIFFFISLPIKIGKDMYSLFGGYNEEGSIYSLFGIIQVAKDRALSIAGISFKQSANETIHGIGVSFYQRADKRAYQFFGLSLYQTGVDVIQCLGISFCQWPIENAMHGIGFSFLQIAKTDTMQIFGVQLYQEAERDTVCKIGISFYSYAKEESRQFFGVRVLTTANKIISESMLCLIIFSKIIESRK